MNYTMSSSSASERSRHIRHRGNDDDDDDDYFAHSRYYPRQTNSSITASVTINVSPQHYHLLSWALLWMGFILAIGLASYQVHKENKWFAARKREEQQGAAEGEGSISSADWTRSRVCTFWISEGRMLYLHSSWMLPLSSFMSYSF